MSITHEILNTGAKMPRIGLGTWKSKPGEVRAAVEAAIDAGYRHIDCALVYGNENEVGDGIQNKIKQGTVKREDLFITTKLWLTYYKGRVNECFQASLKSLKLDYVDLYLMHWPFALDNSGQEGKMIPLNSNGKAVPADIHYTEVWKEVEKIYEAGSAKAIGISNFNIYQMERLLKVAKVVPAMHQYEIHPYLGQNELFDFCKSKGISVTAYSPFGSPDRPAQSAGDPVVLDDPILKKVGEKYGKTAAHISLRYLMKRGIVVIPKSVTTSRIRSNIDVFDFELTGEDMAAVKAIDRNWRALPFALVDQHKYYPFRPNYSE